MTLFDDAAAKETARLLDGLHAAERDRRALERTAVKAQEAVDQAASEAARWQKAYEDHARALACRARQESRDER